ncbi:MAG: HAMP domain-containing histidine kinase [Desulfuromonadales bacterium]|nr:HAMP domain-containing histidine kinase [Desulfuromonadales bacterium]
MKIINKILQPFASFRGQLLGIVSVGIISLALTASLTTAWVTGNQAADQMVAQGLKIAETLAEQSILSLLYESPVNAEKPLEAILSFPDVVRVGVFHNNMQPLLVKGAEQLEIPTVHQAENIKKATLINETRRAWHFVAPVQAGSSGQLFPEEDFQFQLGTEKTEFLGYAYVVMDKSTLRELQLNVTLNNLFIALSFAVVLTLLVNFGIDRLSRPLYKLISVMEQNEREKTRVYADLSGPKEITNIASVFNRMMSSLDERDRRLREHGEKLESEVEIRTRELVVARDAALTASRHKSAFLANMSHELRTPLQAIIGYTDVVREELEMEGMDENAEELNRVMRNANRLLSLINNILDMAKIESGKMDLDLQSVNLKNVLNEATDTVLPILRQNNNRLETDLHFEQDSLIVDRKKLLQMILNLLSNAGKFTKDGTVKLISQLNPNLLVIKVIDTGIGLTEDQLKIIFEEFRQVDGSSTRDFEGTGLGLAITKRFAEQMGGRIEVESEAGKGSTFSIRIPLPVRMEGQAIQHQLSAESGEEFIATT